jgi:hypothetical protein
MVSRPNSAHSDESYVRPPPFLLASDNAADAIAFRSRFAEQSPLRTVPTSTHSGQSPLRNCQRRPIMARYGKKAQSKVEKTMRERKRGTLRSGRSGRKVTSRKQAIAIGLSEARRAGAKVPRKRKSGKKR